MDREPCFPSTPLGAPLTPAVQPPPASMEGVEEDGEVILIRIIFTPAAIIKPWQDKDRAKEWLMDKCFRHSEETNGVLVQKIKFDHHYGMTAYLRHISNHDIDDVVMPRLGQLVGHKGKVRRLSAEEVGVMLVRDMAWKSSKGASAQAVGDLSSTKDLLMKALELQGSLPQGEVPTKKRRRCGQQAVQVLERSQRVASYKLREMQAPEDDDEE